MRPREDRDFDTRSALSSAAPSDVSIFDASSDYQACLGEGSEDFTDTESVSESEIDISEFEGWTMEQLIAEIQALLQEIRDSIDEVLNSPDTPHAG